MSAVPCLLPPDQAAEARLRADVSTGLRAATRTLPPALFYDARGAELFEAICELPEYYPTRTEHAILATHAADLAALVGPHAAIIEPGSGAATKVRHLLRRLHAPVAYLPVDIAGGQLRRVAAERAREFPALTVRPLFADYRDRVLLPPLPAEARRVVFFPGSTIGNLHPAEAASYLRQLGQLVGPRGGLILGVDRRKDASLLHAAYNDAAGVTAEFNLNVLARLNREFDGTFEPVGFRHQAFFNAAASRIEMHLEAVGRQRVQVDGLTLDFAPGDTLRTEVSYKYDAASLDALAAAGGWRVVARFSDPSDWFWVCWMELLPHQPSSERAS